MEIQNSTASSIEFLLDSELYSIEVLFKCFYWYGESYVVVINKDSNKYRVTVKSINGEPINQINLMNKIYCDLIDFKTREIVYKETHLIRELIIAKAFANDEDLEEIPKGLVSDPLGFNPNEY